jgi:flagellar biosynthesis protein FlhB
MNAHLVPIDGGGLSAVGGRALWAGAAAVALPIAFIVFGGIAGGSIQHRPLWTFQPLKPQFSRVSPMAGFKRLFGREAFVQFIKGLLKIVIVGAVAGTLLWNERDRLDGLTRIEPTALMPAILALSARLLGGVLAIYAFLALGDAVYQRLSWKKRQMMSKRELKEEYKEQEGSPEIKARLRQIRLARVKKRMMKAVPDATVVVTNPTHYAVALKYETGMAAPVCVAKGVDSLALRIRAVAAEHGVAVVENPPLARALHATVDIDDEIPVEHYKAVAEVIGYVLRLRRRAS